MIVKVKRTDNIFLIGLMGAGKSTIGRQLAKNLGKKFRDSDSEIEKRTGVDIDMIFAIEGEEGFRQRETGMIKELVEERGIVLATGGGAPLSDENQQLLKNNGLIIYLRASAEHLAGRTSRNKKRPLLQSGDKFKKISELSVQREPIYSKLADITIETGARSVRHVVKEISRMVNQP